MRSYIFFILTICTLTNCSGTKSLKNSDFNMSPETVGKLVTDDLLSRPEKIATLEVDITNLTFGLEVPVSIMSLNT